MLSPFRRFSCYYLISLSIHRNEHANIAKKSLYPAKMVNKHTFSLEIGKENAELCYPNLADWICFRIFASVKAEINTCLLC